ncbi:unnamed protein product [Closterium sp. Yama58-4]|nr:unnamed protein product [Closterium sp. Yama58-4]
MAVSYSVTKGRARKVSFGMKSRAILFADVRVAVPIQTESALVTFHLIFLANLAEHRDPSRARHCTGTESSLESKNTPATAATKSRERSIFYFRSLKSATCDGGGGGYDRTYGGRQQARSYAQQAGGGRPRTPMAVPFQVTPEEARALLREHLTGHLLAPAIADVDSCVVLLLCYNCSGLFLLMPPSLAPCRKCGAV